MHHLIIDTCVWQDLAETECSLIDKLAVLIDQGKVTILLPEIIRDEWNAGKDSIVEIITKKIVDLRRSANQYLSMHGVDKNTQTIGSFFDIDPKSLGEKLAQERINAIDEIFDHSTTIQLSISETAKRLAVDLALSKKAPFRNKNSMADALIFFTAVEWVDTNSPASAYFVSHNTSDFSDKKQGANDKEYNKRLASDLRPYVEKNGLKYAVIIGQVLNEIEMSLVTNEELERGEAVVEHIRVMDDTVESVMSSVLQAAQKQAEMHERMMSGPILAAQKQAEMYERMMSGPIQAAQKQAEMYKRMMTEPIHAAQNHKKMIKEVKQIENKANEIEKDD